MSRVAMNQEIRVLAVALTCAISGCTGSFRMAGSSSAEQVVGDRVVAATQSDLANPRINLSAACSQRNLEPETHGADSPVESANSLQVTTVSTRKVSSDRESARPAELRHEPGASDRSGPEVMPTDPTDDVDSADPNDVSRMPLDLSTVLRLAGADNWAVRLAREQVNEACANANFAETLWLPNVNLGIGYTRHNGELQATDGTVTDISRNSLFLGAGARVSDAPLTGASGGPARFFVDLSLADALFEPLAATQQLSARRSQESAVFNATLLEASLAYYDLVAAQGQLAIARRDLDDARAVERLTEAFVRAGKSAQAEVTRVHVETSVREQRVIQASLAVRVASTRLARILQLDPRRMSPDTLLHSIEEMPAPVELVQNDADIQSVISQAMANRPEVWEAVSREDAASTRVAQEQWRPWLPHLNLGLSGGAFGGQAGTGVNRLGGRVDVDAGLVWEVRNLGFGTAARQQQRESQHRQAVLSRHQLADAVAAEAAEAWFQVQARQEALQLARENIATATEVYEKNRERIRGLVGLPLEALQSLQAVSTARYTYLKAVTDFNQAQCRLLRAIGQPVVAP